MGRVPVPGAGPGGRNNNPHPQVDLANRVPARRPWSPIPDSFLLFPMSHRSSLFAHRSVMNTLLVILFVVGWIVLMRWVLPHFGVGT